MANKTHSQSVSLISEEYVQARITFECWLDRFNEVYALEYAPLVGTFSDDEDDDDGEEGVFTQAELDHIPSRRLNDALYYLQEVQEILQLQIDGLEEVLATREGAQEKR
jgi:hypothetical protein